MSSSTQAKPSLLAYDLALWQNWLEAHGHPKYRARQILHWLYQRRSLDPSAWHTINKPLRAQLCADFTPSMPTIAQTHIDPDGTIKWIMSLDSKQQIETVFIPEDNRGTLCISSQVGCALACSFCATGLQGLNRNLKTHEIIGQLWQAIEALKKAHCPERERPITNVVFMGMGEPLMNEKHVFPAINLMLDDHAFGLSKYRVTVSTSGVVPAMERLANASPCSLAVSLHAPLDPLRDILVPLNKTYPLKTLMEACKHHFKGDKRRSVVFEYVMLKDVNDKPEHAKALIKLMQGIRAKINLIPYNPVPSLPYECSTEETMAAFQQMLRKHIVTTRRKTRGDQVTAACGQLAGAKQDRTLKSLVKPQTHLFKDGSD